MSAVRELILDEWMPLEEAADYLRVTRQAAGQAAIRLGWERRRIMQVILVSRADVERYRRERKMTAPRGPRRRPDPPS